MRSMDAYLQVMAAPGAREVNITGTGTAAIAGCNDDVTICSWKEGEGIHGRILHGRKPDLAWVPAAGTFL